jgi:hypothetical protein
VFAFFKGKMEIFLAHSQKKSGILSISTEKRDAASKIKQNQLMLLPTPGNHAPLVNPNCIIDNSLLTG